MSAIIEEYSSVSGIESDRDVVVIVMGARREDEDGNLLGLTNAQKDTAMTAAKAVLECVGAEVNANSTAFRVPAISLADDEYIRVKVSLTVEKLDPDEEE